MNSMTPDLISFEKQGEDVQSLLFQVRKNELVHACLISGEKGLGKRTFARLIAASLLCRSDGTRPCGICPSCKMIQKNDHPDLLFISRTSPDGSDIKEKASISVDDIRGMIQAFGTSTLDGYPRIALIYEADKMTVQAQNCLLKTLEEPPENTCILLITEHPDVLLPTIISRCRHIRLKRWRDDYISEILDSQGISSEKRNDIISAANGSVGKALELANDEQYWKIRSGIVNDFFGTTERSSILKISTEWKEKKNESDRLFGILESLVRMLLQQRIRHDSKEQIDKLFPERWKEFAENAEPERFVFLLDSISSARKQTLANVNFQAIVEQLLYIFMGE